jgi:hypothetical protein
MFNVLSLVLLSFIVLIFYGGSKLLGWVYSDNILSHIPEYAELKTKNEEAKQQLEVLKAAGGKSSRELVKSVKVAAAKTGEIAILKEKLESVVGDLDAARAIQDESTETIKRLNKAITYSFMFKDNMLVKHMDALRDNLTLAITHAIAYAKKPACELAKSELPNLINSLDLLYKSDPGKLDAYCASDAKATWSPIRKEVEMYYMNMCPPGDEMCSHVPALSIPPNHTHRITKILDKFEILISYVVSNYFCSSEKKFKIDEFKKFISDVVLGVCGSDETTARVLGGVSDYLIRKPLSYLPG